MGGREMSDYMNHNLGGMKMTTTGGICTGLMGA